VVHHGRASEGFAFLQLPARKRSKLGMTCPAGRVLQRSKLKEHLGAKANSNRFYPLCANCVEKVETIGGHHHRMRSSLSYKLSREGRNDEGAERRPSRFSRRGFRGTSLENGPHFSEKNSPKKACLENACLFWLVMLYYKRSRLNGLGSPSGIVRHVTHQRIPGRARRNWKDGSWVIHSTWKRKLKGKAA
jgi:hypothetical protein